MKKGSKKGAAPKTEEILKAVVLADSFTKELRPITLQAPRVGCFGIIFDSENLLI